MRAKILYSGTLCSRTLRVYALLFAALLSLPAAAQNAEPSRPTSTPYTGDLSIFDTPGREQRLQIDRVMNLLHLAPGKNVADIGAGSGWFTLRAARRVAPGGTVFAEDINPAAVRTIQEKAQGARLGNVVPVLGRADDPRLPDSSVDAVLMLKMYHEIAHPLELLHRLRPALRPGALVGIIDRNGNGADHGLREEIVVREMAAEGFREVGRYDFVKADGEDYFLIFRAER